MKRTGLFVITLSVCLMAQAADPLEREILSSDRPETKTGSLQGILTMGLTTTPTTKFSTGASKINLHWKGKGLQAGDKVRALWIAEDVGIAAPKNSRVTSGTVTAYKPDDEGLVALARPKGGWPAGKYRLELYLNRQLTQIIRFTIEPDVVVEVHHDAN